MKAGATQTLFFFREVRQNKTDESSTSTATVQETPASHEQTSHDSARVAESSAPLSLNVLVRPNPPRPITLNARGPDQVLVFEMSQYVARATGMATKALDVAKTRVLPPAVEWYNATMAKNAQYVVKDPEAVDKLGKQLIYSNMAKLPAAVEAAQGEIKVVQQKWANRMDLPMTEVRSPGAMSSVIPRTVFACPARVFLARGVGSIEGRPKSHPRLTYPLSAHRRLAPPLSSPRRCTRGSASGKSSAEAGA
jgi:F-type H+-transporting ATPase subunit g